MNRWFVIAVAILVIGAVLIFLNQPQECDDIGGVGRCGALVSPFLIGFVTIMIAAFLAFLGLMRGSR